MKKILLFFFFAGLFTDVLGFFKLFGKDRDTTWGKCQKFRKHGWCDDLDWDTMASKYPRRYLQCNKTAVAQKCRDRATDFYYATTYENVSRAVRGAAHLFPDIAMVIRAMEHISYDAIDCLHHSFVELQNEMIESNMDPIYFVDNWRESCRQYDDEIDPMIAAMNETHTPGPDLFIYTYPDLHPTINLTTSNFLIKLSALWSYQAWSGDDFYRPWREYTPFLMTMSEPLRLNFSAVCDWAYDLVHPDGIYNADFNEYATLVYNWSTLMMFHTNLSDELYDRLLQLNLQFEEYYRENVITFWIDLLNRLIAENVADDKSDAVITKVSYIIADLVTNATNNTAEPENPGPPPNEYLDRICDYLVNSSIDLPSCPGFEHGYYFFRFFNRTTMDCRRKYGGHTNWFWRRDSPGKKNHGHGGGKNHGGHNNNKNNGKNNNGKNNNGKNNNGKNNNGGSGSNKNNNNNNKNHDSKNNGGFNFGNLGSYGIPGYNSGSQSKPLVYYGSSNTNNNNNKNTNSNSNSKSNTNSNSNSNSKSNSNSNSKSNSNSNSKNNNNNNKNNNKNFFG